MGPTAAEEVPRGERVLGHALVLLGVGLGAGSLLAFGGFLYVGSHQLVDLDLPPGSILIWDALLSLAFFAQHSGMVRRCFRRRLASVVPDAYHGALYSAASGFALLAVLGLWQTSSPALLSLEGPPRVIGRVLFGLSTVGFFWGVRALGSFDAFGRRPVMDRLRGVTREEAPLSARGPYRFVRHPLYTFTLGLVWSCPDVTADRLLFDLLWSAWIVIGCVLEERDLVARFGVAYRDYQRRVPMLIPGWRRPGGGRWPS